MLRIHHIGCMVENIEASKEMYRNNLNFQNISETIYILSQKIYVSFVEVGDGIFIELIQPEDNTSPLARLRKKGIDYYHVGYMARNADAVISELCEKGAALVTSFPSKAFNNQLCTFLYTPDHSLIEIVEEGHFNYFQFK